MSTHHLFFNQIFSKIISGQDWKYEIAFIETESSQECWIFCWSVQISFQELTSVSFSPKSTHQTWEFHLWTGTNLTSKFGRLMNVFSKMRTQGPSGWLCNLWVSGSKLLSSGRSLGRGWGGKFSSHRPRTGLANHQHKIITEELVLDS